MQSDQSFPDSIYSIASVCVVQALKEDGGTQRRITSRVRRADNRALVAGKKDGVAVVLLRALPTHSIPAGTGVMKLKGLVGSASISRPPPPK